ncbi:TetR/AcrR family transcriptional regulator [[Mycobacterium] holstebronense]|uniref:TetR family transcriptional regulator n=1 Tax=[Mycobacterium] holstebronense TaxID=3064288 RepID=A0ABM9M2N5_9MYCO|nr:TetR/AcrR family transcriptional regulator [Mycolicibacter sp. MU0102]CAJ1509173.1 TetR family transcriptional regulator [Mycolicibacter sp. MU0102]
MLGADGARGLSHPKVDRRARMPAGTTSFYFRTRKALMHATASRVTELDLADLSAMSELADDGDGRASGTMGLATMVVLAGAAPWVTRTRARYELAMEAGRDPELAEIIRQSTTQFHELVRRAVSQWQTHDSEPDPAMLDEQTYAVLRFVNGVMVESCQGHDVDRSAEQVDRLIRAIIAGVREQHAAD